MKESKDIEQLCKQATDGADKETLNALINIALDSRKQELQFLWQRSSFFWLFTAAALTAFLALKNELPLVALAVSGFGFLASFSWTLLNRGSKYWYESWEKKVSKSFRLKAWFTPIQPDEDEDIEWLDGRRFSPSRLIIGVSDYVALFWFGALIYQTLLAIHIFFPDELRFDVPAFLLVSGQARPELFKLIFTALLSIFTLAYSYIVFAESANQKFKVRNKIFKNIHNSLVKAAKNKFIQLLLFISIAILVLFFQSWESLSMLTTIITSLITSLLTGIVTFLVQERRLKAELRTEFMAEIAVKELLQNPAWKLRSFAEIKRKVGGFDDNELRKLLIRAGAVRFYDNSDKELWGLLSRNQASLNEQKS